MATTNPPAPVIPVLPTDAEISRMDPDSLKNSAEHWKYILTYYLTNSINKYVEGLYRQAKTESDPKKNETGRKFQEALKEIKKWTSREKILELQRDVTQFLPARFDLENILRIIILFETQLLAKAGKTNRAGRKLKVTIPSPESFINKAVLFSAPQLFHCPDLFDTENQKSGMERVEAIKTIRYIIHTGIKDALTEAIPFAEVLSTYVDGEDDPIVPPPTVQKAMTTIKPPEEKTEDKKEEKKEDKKEVEKKEEKKKVIEVRKPNWRSKAGFADKPRRAKKMNFVDTDDEGSPEEDDEEQDEEEDDEEQDQEQSEEEYQQPRRGQKRERPEEVAIKFRGQQPYQEVSNKRMKRR